MFAGFKWSITSVLTSEFSLRGSFLVDDAMGMARNKASVLCPSPSEPCCVWGDAVPALLGTAGVQEGSTGVLGGQWQPRGVSAVCVGLQSPSTGRRRSAASPPWAATPSGGSGTPQSVSTWAMAPPALQLSRATQGTLCSLFYCLVTSPTSKRWESGKRPFPVGSKLFPVNYLIVWVQSSAKCYHCIVHLKKKKKRVFEHLWNFPWLYCMFRSK